MAGLEPVTGEYHLYLKSIAKDNCQAFFWRLQAAFTCALVLSREQDAWITEAVLIDGKKVTRIYRFPKGGGMPELLEAPPQTPAPRANGRKLEIDVR